MASVKKKRECNTRPTVETMPRRSCHNLLLVSEVLAIICCHEDEGLSCDTKFLN